MVTSPSPSLPEAIGEALRSGPAGASRRLVLLHGWGADADDLLGLAAALVDPDVSVVALRAPHPNPGGPGRQWYDLMPEPAWEQLPGARADLRRRLEALGHDVPLDRTAVLGFSQGAAMALDAATDARLGVLPLAGLVGCSGYPHPDWMPAAPLPPVLLTHGGQDPVVNPAFGAEVLRRLQSTGAGEPRLRQLTFPGGHGIDPGLLPTIRSFLAEVLAAR